MASKWKGPARFLAEKNRNGLQPRNRKTVSPFEIGSIQLMMAFRNFTPSLVESFSTHLASFIKDLFQVILRVVVHDYCCGLILSRHSNHPTNSHFSNDFLIQIFFWKRPGDSVWSGVLCGVWASEIAIAFREIWLLKRNENSWCEAIHRLRHVLLYILWSQFKYC